MCFLSYIIQLYQDGQYTWYIYRCRPISHQTILTGAHNVIIWWMRMASHMFRHSAGFCDPRHNFLLSLTLSFTPIIMTKSTTCWKRDSYLMPAIKFMLAHRHQRCPSIKKTIDRVYGKAPLLQTAGISVSGTVLSLTTDNGLAYFRPTVTDSLEWFLEDSRAAGTRDLSVSSLQCRSNFENAGPAMRQHRRRLADSGERTETHADHTLLQCKPSRHKTLNHCWFDVGPPSADGDPTLNQHWFNVLCLLRSQKAVSAYDLQVNRHCLLALQSTPCPCPACRLPVPHFPRHFVCRPSRFTTDLSAGR